MTDEDEGPRLITVERGGEVLGFVAIDSTIRGQARGGVRLVPEVSEAEIRDAARAMTLKYGLLQLPQGGAKGGVSGDPDAPLGERRARLLEFGRAIEPLLRDRAYVPDADMGTTADDMRWMFGALGLSFARREWHGGNSGLWTAESVVAAARAALATLGRSLERSSVTIEGFGAVGSAVATLAKQHGARVVAISTSLGALYEPRGLDVEKLLALRQIAGSEVVVRFPDAERLPRERLLELPADVLFPCARHHSVHTGNVANVQVRVVCPGANGPLSEEAEKRLDAAGVRCVPDFVANCGGVLGGTMAFASIGPRDIRRCIANATHDAVRALFEHAEREGVSPRSFAERLARERFERMQRAALHPTLASRLFAVGLACYRRGLVPGLLTATLSRGWFARRLRLA